MRLKWISYHVYIHINAKPSLLRTLGEQERRMTLDNEWVEVSFLKQTRRQHKECCEKSQKHDIMKISNVTKQQNL